MKYVIIALLWTAYCVLHSALISISITEFMKRRLNKLYAFYRLFYILISLFLLIPLIRYTTQLDNQQIIYYGHSINMIRNSIMIGSLLLFFWSFFIDYDALTFFGIRQIMNYSKLKNENGLKELKKKGLLGIMRHPMYFALIIYLWTQTFKLSDILVNSILTIYVIIGTYLEERKLVLEFGDAYNQYKKEVPMLIPFTKAIT
jgi:methanethiol S-methyltransferase